MCTPARENKILKKIPHLQAYKLRLIHHHKQR